MIGNTAPTHEHQQSHGQSSTASADLKRSMEIIRLLTPRQSLRTPRHSTFITKSMHTMITPSPETQAPAPAPLAIFYQSPPPPSSGIEIDSVKIVSDSQGLFSSPHSLLGSTNNDNDDNAQMIPEFVLESSAVAIAMSDSELENTNSNSNINSHNNSMLRLQPSPKALQFMAFMRAQRRRPLALRPPRPKQHPKIPFIGLRGNNNSNRSK
ncbi:hypothetical protein HK100_009296, partial [Physocladia obscura]